MRQNAGLAEAAVAVCGVVALQIRLERFVRGIEAGLALGERPARLHARRIVLEVFGQIQHVGLDAAMNRMQPGLTRLPQRDDERRETTIFQTGNLLRDEGFRQARIAFDEDGDTQGHGTNRI